MNMKVFCDWVKEVKALAPCNIAINIADVSFDAIEIKVRFIGGQKKPYECREIIDIREISLIERNFFIALNKIKLFVKSHSSCFCTLPGK